MPVIQRLGYLLEHAGHAELAVDLGKLVNRRKPKFVRLEPRSSEAVSDRDSRLHVLVNTTIELEA